MVKEPSPKLGRLPTRLDNRTLRLCTYTDVALKPPGGYFPVSRPSARDWRVLGNDRWGNCTVAAAAHHTQAWQWATEDRYTPNVDELVRTYLALTGGADTGLAMLDVLRHWRSVGVDGYRVDAYVELETRRLHTETRQATFLFGGAYLGLGLPAAAQDQWAARKPWTLRGYQPAQERWRPWSWGGHAVSMVGYGTDGYVRLVTWGRVQLTTWAWLKIYCEEAYAMLSGDWLDGGRSPSGFDRAALERDLARL